MGDCSFGIWRVGVDNVGGTAVSHDYVRQRYIMGTGQLTHIAYSWVGRDLEWVHKRQISLVDEPPQHS